MKNEFIREFLGALLAAIVFYIFLVVLLSY
jgi:hypothetical protein